jgi:hypothetical protein
MLPTRRLLPCAALLLAFAAPAFAQDDAGTTRRPFIERTLIEVPRAVGPWVLVEAKDFPGQVSLGVAFDYDLPAVPGLALNIYVYPAGRMPADQAIAQGMAEVEAGLREYERRGTYADLEFGEAEAFTVPIDATTQGEADLPAGAGGDAPADEAPPADPGDAEAAQEVDQILGWLAQSGAGDTTVPGRRRPHSFLFGGQPGNSLSYLFYRQLYLVKVRASAPESVLSAAGLRDHVDRAVAALVPAIAITNVGDCGVAYVQTDGPQEATMKSLVLETGRLQREGCASEVPAAPVPADHRRLELVFAADAWKGE